MTVIRQTISVELTAEVVLEVGEVWPDGDAPSTITAAAVRDIMRQGGSKSTVLKDWCLLDALRVVAVVDTRPDEGARTTDTAEVWS